MVLRKLRIADESETVDILLEEFFIKSRDGWRNKELDKIISEYQKRSDRNRLNGKSGGRPKNKDLAKPTGLPDGKQVDTESKPDGNLNYKPLTTNQEPVTNNKDLGGYAFCGEVIKLKQKDFDKWQSLYSKIDLTRELERFDLEFSNDKPKNWFMTLSAKLNYQNKNATKPTKRDVNAVEPWWKDQPQDVNNWRKPE